MAGFSAAAELLTVISENRSLALLYSKKTKVIKVFVDITQIWTFPVQQHLRSVSGYFVSVRSQCSSSGPRLLRGFVTTAGTHPAD